METRNVAAALALALALGAPARGAVLDPRGVQVLDVNGAIRQTFSDSESIAMAQSVFNGAASSGTVQFSFQILNPRGAVVFTHTGNAAPGSAGVASTRVSGLAIRRFWTGPGTYTLAAAATLNGFTVQQQATFGVFSPNISLLYPSDGAREIQPPLSLRWASSGSSSYLVLVANDPAFFKTVFTGPTGGPRNFLDYPENPSDPLQRLSGGQVYYWKVQGLDASGNKIAESSVFSFSLRSQAASASRDLAVVDLELEKEEATPSGQVAFRVKVANLGGTTEPNVKLTLTLSGLEAPDSPKVIPMLAPGETKEYVMHALFPPNQANSVAFATVVLQDDNPLNNFKQLGLAKVEVPALSPPATGQLLLDAGDRRLRPEEAWNMVQTRVPPEASDKLKGYRLVAIESEGLDPRELGELLDALSRGRARVTRAEVK